MHGIIRTAPVILHACLFEVAIGGFTIIIDIFFLLKLNLRVVCEHFKEAFNPP